MADLDINLGFITDEDSIRRIQKDITRAFNGIKPDINVQLPTGFFNSFKAELAKLEVPFNIDPATIASSIQKIRDSLKFSITEVNVSQVALDALNKQIEKSTAKATLALQIENAFGAKGGGPRSAKDKASLNELKTRASEQGLVVPEGKATNNLEVLTKQREKAFTELARIEAERFLIENNIKNALEQELSAIQQARDIEQDIVGDRADLAAAGKRLTALSPRGGTPKGLEGNEDFAKQRALRLAAIETAQAQLGEAKGRLADEKAAASQRSAILQRENSIAEAANNAATDLANKRISVKQAVSILAKATTETAAAQKQQLNEIAGDSELEKARALREKQVAFLRTILGFTNADAVVAAAATAQRKQANDELRKDLSAIRALRKIDEGLASGRETPESAQRQKDKLIPTAPPTQLRTADPNNPAVSAITNSLRLALGQQLDVTQRSIDSTSQLATTTAEVNRLQNKELADIQTLEDARRLLATGTLSAANALKVGERVAPAAQSLSREREGAGFDPQTAQFRALADSELASLKLEAAEVQKRLEDVKASERAAADMATAIKEQVDILNRTNAIGKRLEAGTRTTRQAQDTINKLREEPAASPQRLAEGDAREFNRLREQQLNAAQDDVNARIAGVEKLKKQERAENELFAAISAEKNASLEARKIRQDLNNGLLEAREAASQIRKIERRDPISSSVSDPAAAAQLQDERDKELQAAKNLVKLKQQQIDAEKIISDDAKAIEAADEQNIKIRRRINSILQSEASGRASAETTRNRLANIEVDALGTNSRSVNELLLTNQNRLNNAIALDNKDKEILAGLNKEVATIDAVNQDLLRQAGITKKQSKLQNDVARQIQNELFESQKAGAGNPPQRKVGPSDVLFRNAADVTQFTNSLNPQQLERFTQSLRGTGKAVNDTQRSVDKFGNSLVNGGESTGKINKNMQRGANFAQEFGRQVTQAATRLLAWAAPANLIFLTVTRLRQAVKEIINIDREARRLIFFRNVGSIITQSTVAFSNSSQAVRELDAALKSSQLSFNSIISATSKLTATNESLGKEFQTIASIARSFGLSIGSVAEALVTVARVGQQATNATGDFASTFTIAALSLVRLERGALGATEAVRGLTAIQAQFFGGIKGGSFTTLADEATRASIAVQLTSNAAAILATTSAGSSANVSELTDAATRLGSAFVNLQGLNFPQTIAILGEAFTATGATTGRLATALRQSATLIKQNAAEISELTNKRVTVVDPGGSIKGFQAILDVLKEIKREGASLKAVDLSLLIADRRNVADVAALAQNVEALQAAFNRFKNPVERINRVVAAQIALFKENESLAQSLEGKINSLEVAFKTLVSDTAVRGFLDGVIGGFTGLVDALSVVTGFIGEVSTQIPGLLQIISALVGGLALVGTIKGVRDVAIGFKLAFGAAAKLNQEIATGSALLVAEETTQAGILKLKQAGLISEAQSVVIATDLGIIRGKQSLALANQARLEAEILALQAAGPSQVRKLLVAKQAHGTVIKEIIALNLEELAVNKGITAEIQKQRALEASSARTGGSFSRLKAGLGVVIAAAIVTGVAKEMGPDGEASKRISSGFEGAIIGGIAGANIGKVGGPWGIVIGFLVGFFEKELKGALDRVAKEAKVLFENISPELSKAQDEALEFTAIMRDLEEVQKGISERLKDAVGDRKFELEEEQKLLASLREQIKVEEALTAAKAARLEFIRQGNVVEESELPPGTPRGGPGATGNELEQRGRARAGVRAGRIARDAIRQTEIALLQLRAGNGSFVERRNALSASVAEATALTQESQNAADAARIELELRIKVNKTLEENIKLAKIIAGEGVGLRLPGEVEDNPRATGVGEPLRDRERILKAIEQRNRNLKFLQEDQVSQILANIAAQKLTAEVLREQEDALRRINKLADFEQSIVNGLAQLDLGKDNTKLQFTIDKQAFDSAVERINRALAEQIKNIDILGRTDKDVGDEIAKKKIAAEQEIDKLQAARLNDLISKQKAVLNEATDKTLTQIDAWENAAKKVTDAFSEVVSQQNKLAGTFADIGAINAAIIESSFNSVGNFLEEIGASVAERLALVADRSNAQLRAAQDVASQQSGTLGDRFGTGAEINSALESLINSVGRASAFADQKILNERSNVVNEEIVLTRERARAERTNFQRKVGETQREIEINNKRLNQEIEILNVRLEAEREFNALRRSQLKEFGDLLIESPKDFKRELDNVRLAKRFFKGITDLSEESLRTVRNRSQRLRGRGEGGQDILRQIRDGLETSIRTGGTDVISGVGNQQLREIFSSVQDDTISSIDDVADSIKKQSEAAVRRLEVERKIEERQKALFALAQLSSALEQAQLDLTNFDSTVAIKQREIQITKLEELKQKQEDARRSFDNGIQGIIKLFTVRENSRKVLDDLFKGGVFERGLGQLLRDSLKQQGVNPTGGPADFSRFFDFGLGLEEIQKQAEAAAEKEAQRQKEIIQEGGKVLDSQATQREELNKTIETVKGFKASLDETIDTLSQFGPTFGPTPKSPFDKLTDELNNQIRTAVGGRTAIVPKELQDLNKLQENGGQLTRDERRRQSVLERRSRKTFSADDNAAIARKLFKDNAKQIISDTRDQFRDTVGRTDEFTDVARRLRGEGSRGAAGVNVDAVREFFEKQGFEGTARKINTRVEATAALDRVIELSERLAKEQGKISRETQKKIIEILADELVPGIKDIVTEAKAAAKEAGKEDSEQATNRADEFIGRLEKKLEDIVVKVSEEQLKVGAGQLKAVSEVLTRDIASNVESGIKRGLEPGVSVNVEEIVASLRVSIPEALDVAGLSSVLKEALRPLIGDAERLNELSQRLSKLITDLANKNLIQRPVEKSERSILTNDIRAQPIP